MGFTVTGNNTEFEACPEGTHIAVCYGVIDAGFHQTPQYGIKRKLILLWETSEEKDQNNSPFQLVGFYTPSLGAKATLRKHLESWRGRKFTEEELNGFDVRKVLGAPCLITVQHDVKPDGSKRHKVVSVTALPKTTPKPELANKKVFYSVDEPATSSPKSDLPEWINDLLGQCVPDPLLKKVATINSIEDDGGQSYRDGEIPF